MLIVFCCMAGIGFGLFAYYMAEPREGLPFIPVILGLLVVIWWLIQYYSHMHDSIIVTEAALTYEPSTGQPLVVPWHQITSLAPHSLRGRYDVLDEHGHCLMYIPYDLENFLQLDSRLREHLKQKSPDGRTTFTIHRAGSKIVFAIGVSCVVLFLATLMFPTKGLDLRGVVVSCISPLLIWWGLFGTVERIVITKGGLLIEYWKRVKPIPFNTIQGVMLRDGDLSIQRAGLKSFKLRSRG